MPILPIGDQKLAAYFQALFGYSEIVVHIAMHSLG